MMDQGASGKIEKEFLEGMKAIAASRGLEFGRVRTKEMKTKNQSQRTWMLWRQTGQGGKERLQLFYFKIKSVANRPQRYDWAVAGSIVKNLTAASARAGVPWALVLLRGSATCGYCLPAREVESRLTDWHYHRENGEYGIVEEELPGHFCFGDLAKLLSLAGME